jgi:hypothetical protein
MEQQNPNPLADRTFFKIAAFSTALGLGIMCAFLASLKDIRNDTSLVFTVWTVIWFLLGAAIGWGFWAFVRRKTTAAK